MGATQSTELQETWDAELAGLEGFHILKLKPNSPAESSGLRPYFDIIVSVDGINTLRTIQEFAQHLSKRMNQEVSLTVLSMKARALRELKLVPRGGWSSNASDGLLGCSVRFSSVERAQSSTWHILDIHPSSPAERAGLQAYSDYVIGCEHRNLENEDDFFDLVYEHENKILSLVVYNAVWDNCRDVVIIPKSDWGGEGLLGCGVACGLLHRIPADPELAQVPQETVSERPSASEPQELTKGMASLDLTAPPSVIPKEATPVMKPKEGINPSAGLDLSSLPSILPSADQSPNILPLKADDPIENNLPKPALESTSEVTNQASPIEEAAS
ncbi:hypothetical protein DSO57_1000920 [Entomophthora muscae]|uniref:Uncharacterized protein n=1 Tax=Entomophthora muscae TaxID=34485 RepID=A0ACC2TJT5_9FUNG|nr:hypothetical protein DSO57_1000920 [Entomophthora muscae]